MYLLVADDITGGNDAGVHFAGRGLETRMAVAADAMPLRGSEPEMFVVNTNSRNMAGADAAQCMRGVAAAFRCDASRPELVLKKMDSTLRGNPGAEIDALLRGFGFRAGFLALACPAHGRTVRNGRLYVNGVPLHETVFANDPLMPAKESSVAAALAGQSRLRMERVGLDVVDGGPENIAARVTALAADGAELFIFDAETAEQIDAVAAAGMRMPERPLFIGAAGFAESLANLLPRGRHAASGVASPDRIFFICGSAHQATRVQMDELLREEAGMARHTIEGETGAVAAALAAALDRGDALLTTPCARRDGGLAAGREIDGKIGDTAVAVLRKLGVAPRSLALVMTGGDTAYAVLQRICSGVALHREILPGVVLGGLIGGEWDGLAVVTKAGGFGTPRALADIARILRRREAQNR